MEKFPPAFTPQFLTQPAKHGVSSMLEGKWVNHNPTNIKFGWGIHTTCLLSSSTKLETFPGNFHFLCENYTDELTFTLVDGGVRNQARTNEQFCGAVKYVQSFQDLKGIGLYVENGMYLWLDYIYNHPADDASIKTDIGFPKLVSGDGSNGPTFVPNNSISRSGTIPQGSTVKLFGKHSQVTEGTKPDSPHGCAAWDFDHPAISETMGGAGTTPDTSIDLDAPAPPWVSDTTPTTDDPSGKKTCTYGSLAHELYPYSVCHDLRLRDDIGGQNI